MHVPEDDADLPGVPGPSTATQFSFIDGPGMLYKYVNRTVKCVLT